MTQYTNSNKYLKDKNNRTINPYTYADNVLFEDKVSLTNKLNILTRELTNALKGKVPLSDYNTVIDALSILVEGKVDSVDYIPAIDAIVRRLALIEQVTGIVPTDINETLEGLRRDINYISPIVARLDDTVEVLVEDVVILERLTTDAVEDVTRMKADMVVVKTDNEIIKASQAVINEDLADLRDVDFKQGLKNAALDLEDERLEGEIFKLQAKDIVHDAELSRLNEKIDTTKIDLTTSLNQTSENILSTVEEVNTSLTNTINTTKATLEASISETSNTLSASIDALEGTVNNTINTEIATINSDLVATKARVTTSERDIESLEALTVNHTFDITSLNSKVNNNKTEVDKDIETNLALINSNKVNITSNDRDIEANLARINANKGFIDSANREIVKIKADHAKDVATINTSIDNINTVIDTSINTALEQVDADITELQGNMTTALTDKVDKVAGKSLVLDTDITQITTNKNSIASIEGRLDTIETDWGEIVSSATTKLGMSINHAVGKDLSSSCSSFNNGDVLISTVDAGMNHSIYRKETNTIDDYNLSKLKGFNSLPLTNLCIAKKDSTVFCFSVKDSDGVLDIYEVQIESRAFKYASKEGVYLPLSGFVLDKTDKVSYFTGNVARGDDSKGTKVYSFNSSSNSVTEHCILPIGGTIDWIVAGDHLYGRRLSSNVIFEINTSDWTYSEIKIPECTYSEVARNGMGHLNGDLVINVVDGIKGYNLQSRTWFDFVKGDREVGARGLFIDVGDKLISIDSSGSIHEQNKEDKCLNVQFKRGTSEAIAKELGLSGQVLINTDTNSLHVMDGVTTGGHTLATKVEMDTNKNSIATLDAKVNSNKVELKGDISTLRTSLEGSIEEVDSKVGGLAPVKYIIASSDWTLNASEGLYEATLTHNKNLTIENISIRFFTNGHEPVGLYYEFIDTNSLLLVSDEAANMYAMLGEPVRSESFFDNTKYYMKEEVDSQLVKKADSSNVYSKGEVNTIIEPLGGVGLPTIYNEEFADTNTKVQALMDAGNEVATLMYFTDTHFNEVIPDTWSGNEEIKRLLQAVSQFRNEQNWSAIIHGGDIWGGDETGAAFRQNVKGFNKLIRQHVGNIPFIMSKGNHDDCSLRLEPENYSMPIRQYNDFNNTSTTKTIDAINKNRLYNFIDDPRTSTRIITLNSIDIPYIQIPTANHLKYRGLKTYAYSNEQIHWLADTALNFEDKSDKNNWSIVVVSHVPILETVNTDTVPHNNEVVYEILCAFINGTAYTSTPTTGDFTQSISVDYTPNGKFGGMVIALYGHVHRDFINKSDKADFFSVSTTNAHRYMHAVVADRPNKIFNTSTETAMDILVIDKTERKVNFIRFGAGDDREVIYQPVI